MDGWILAITQGIVTSIIWAIIVFLSGLIFKNFLKKQVTLWKAILGVSLAIIPLSLLFTAIFYNSNSPKNVSNLAEYFPISLVNDDLDGSDFGWVSGDDTQVQKPGLVNSEIDGIRGTFVRYPVELRSVIEDGSYSTGLVTARPQRKLRNSERGEWNALIATIYIKSDDQTLVNVIPYLSVPSTGTINLGFSQNIPTNEWSLVTWREVIDSTLYNNEFIDALTAVQDKYDIRDLGFIRLTHILSIDKSDGTAIGFNFRLISDQDQNVEDSFQGEIYISSLSFLP